MQIEYTWQSKAGGLLCRSKEEALQRVMVDGEFEGLQRICLSSCMITDHLANRYRYLQSRLVYGLKPLHFYSNAPVLCALFHRPLPL